MDCKKIKSIIPRYVNHSATEEEISVVEEHLCVCHECRQYLSDFFDKDDNSLKTKRISVKKDFVKMDIFNIFVVVVGIIVGFLSIWLFVKAH